jgi:pimeloyl-ACP methyl ester carboxylesterase
MTSYTLHRLAPTDRQPVVLIPGVGTGAAVFLPPGQTGLPQTLIMAGYDVWLLDWRAKADTPWTIEDVAREDIPQAIEQVATVTQRPVKIVAHCIGAITTMRAAIKGQLPDVTTIVTNAVSLHPVVPRPTVFRLSAKYGLSGCADPTCKVIRWLYGEVWDHKNLTDATHDWLLSQFHQVPVTFYQHLGRCIRRGQMDLPERPQTTARCVFLAGEANRCFLDTGQMRSYQWLWDHSARRDHSLHVIPDYGHLDMFVGEHAERDIFPLILKELAQ